MFRIKKEDYNSVQLMPDYSSSAMHSTYEMARKKRTAKLIFLGVVLALIAAAGIGYFIYITYFSPADKFVKAFNDSDLSTCKEISLEYAFDETYRAEIEPVVTNAASQIFSTYTAGEMPSEEALETLAKYDDITDGCFSDMLDGLANQITAAEDVYKILDNAETCFLSEMYTEGIENLKNAATAAAEHELDIENRIVSIVNDNINSIKAVMFRRFASEVRRSQFDLINSEIDFVLEYVNDPDFEAYKVTLKDAHDEEITLSAASRSATEIYEAASEALAAEREAASSQTTEEE